MQRQIKFRAIVNVNSDKPKEIRYYDLSRIDDLNRLASEDWAVDQLMQYTGLKDKKGVEIYEGDILKGGIVIIWRPDLASFALTKIGWMHDHYFGEAVDPGQCEVIGNRFENPELLNNG